MLLDQNYADKSEMQVIGVKKQDKKFLTTHRQVDFSATHAPQTGPMTGPSKGASEYKAIACPLSSVFQQSPSTPPPIYCEPCDNGMNWRMM